MSDNLDLSTASGRLMFNVIGAMAECVDDFAEAVALVGLIGIPNEMTPAPDG